jgi:streptogramin lyase
MPPVASPSRSISCLRARGGPYAVSVDGGGIVWVNEINTDTVVRLDPSKDKLEVVKLPDTQRGYAR